MPDLGMVPSLDELGIWELVGDWWSDASRPAPEADVRVAPPAGDDLHVDERAPPEGAVPATEEAIAHPAELALDPNEAGYHFAIKSHNYAGSRCSQGWCRGAVYTTS